MALDLDVRSSLVWPSSTSIDLQNDQTYQSPREDIQRFTRRGPGQWSLRLDKSCRENSGQTTRKLPDNFLPDLPEYFKRANSQSSFSTTKTSHADLSLKKNINLSFSSAVTLQVINNYQHWWLSCDKVGSINFRLFSSSIIMSSLLLYKKI